jgi:hypothetical protein
VYRIEPKPFYEQVVSNVTRLGSFTSSDRATPPFSGKNEGDIYYSKADRKQWLFISPELGFIHYKNEGVRVFNHKQVEGVPDEKTAVSIALDNLTRVGVARSNLVTQPRSRELKYIARKGELGGMDRETKKLVKRVHSWQIVFLRQQDLIEFAGRGMNGGSAVTLGNRGQVLDLEHSWRNLIPHERKATANPAQLVNWINEGKFRIAIGQVTQVGDFSGISKIVVKSVVPYYMGPKNDEHGKYVLPFVTLEGTAMIHGATLPIALHGPLIPGE